MHDRSLPHGKMFMLHPGESVCLTANPTSLAVDVKHITKEKVTFLQAEWWLLDTSL